MDDVAAALLALVAAEAAIPEAAPPAVAPRDEPPAMKTAARRLDVAPLEAALISRPLFTPGRRPLDSADRLAPDADPAPAAKLTGVIVGPEGRAAIFSLDGALRPLVAREGERIGSLTISSIHPGEVVTLGPDGSTTWRIGLGTFVARPTGSGQARPADFDLHSRGQGGQRAE